MGEPRELGIAHLFEAVRDAVVMVDAVTGRIVLWNPAATELFGYDAAEVLGRGAEVLVPERLRAAYHEGLARFARTGHGRYVDSKRTLRVPAVHKSGAEIVVELSLSALDEAPLLGRYVLATVRPAGELRPPPPPSNGRVFFAVPWRLAPRDASGLPAFLERELLDRAPPGTRCELCGRLPPSPLATVLVIERPGDLPVPFLICERCRRALEELRALLESAARAAS
jgi:PAS domain S-box-containing protein